MYCKIEGANTVASTGLKWNQPQDRPLTIHHLSIYIYICMYYVYTYVYTYVYLPKHSPHASHPANLAPQAKSASSMYFLESSWAWSDNWSFYNIFGFSFNFLCCHGAEEQHELNLSLQIVWSPWVWIPGTVCRVLQTFKAWRSGVNGKWNVESENWGFRREFYLRFQHSGTFSCNVKTLTPWLLVILWLTMRELRMSVRLSRNWKLIPKHTSIVLPRKKKKKKTVPRYISRDKDERKQLRSNLGNSKPSTTSWVKRCSMVKRVVPLFAYESVLT